jgi:hypothetical protein
MLREVEHRQPAQAAGLLGERAGRTSLVTAERGENNLARFLMSLLGLH